jgi:PAS domain S-box-containing protein
MTNLSKISLVISIIIMVTFFTTQSLIVFHFINYIDEIGYFGYACFLAFLPFFAVVVLEYLKRNRKGKEHSLYVKKLNETLISQSHNSLFYEGNTTEGAKVLTKEVSDSIGADRCSIWLYNKDKTAIICEQLYIKSEDAWYQNITLYKKDFRPYFLSLLINPIIVANDAETHNATSCFTESYLKPLGVKSMLDVPITYKGETIGVVCIESLTLREWDKVEVDFAQLLSSLYTFAYSVKEGNDLTKRVFQKEIELTNRMDAINRSSPVIEFTIDGKICFANNTFLDAMGYTSEEIVGKHHSIFLFNEDKNSKEYKKFWKKLSDGVFYSGEIIRRKKDGNPIYLSVTYNPIINDDGKPYRVLKIARDITEIVENSEQIQKQNTYLEHAAKILRHDMHSGINTYIPRGVSSLERRLNDDVIKELKLEAPLKMIKEGLRHSQKVYKGVYEFTNLVKKDSRMEKTECNLREILDSYLTSTAYRSQVLIDELPITDVNESLFCTAIDNLIRNGLKYNDSDSKFVKIFMEDELLILQDNGRGLTQEDFEYLSQPYTRKENQKEGGTGLGLNICIAILNEHGFKITCEKNDIGTKMKIKIK